MYMRAAATLLAVLFIQTLACSTADELVIVNARVWTGTAAPSSVTAFVVRDGRFAYVGDDAGARRFAGGGATFRDAGRQHIVPGLVDAHLHLISGGLFLNQLNLRDVPDRAAFIVAVAERASKTPEGEWIIGGRWSTESWPDASQPTKEWIDGVTPNHPVLLSRMDGHGALANSAALRIAGIDAAGPPDPPGGLIERDAGGEPTGILKESAIGLVRRHVPAPSEPQRREALRAAMRHANAHGLTCVHTMAEPQDLATLAAARDAGELTLRVRVYIQAADWTEYLDEAKAYQSDEWVRICGFKHYMDGSLGSRTAYMTEPYSDAAEAEDASDASNRGLLREIMSSPGELERQLQAIAAAGFSPAIHAIGDQANRIVLDHYSVLANPGGRLVDEGEESPRKNPPIVIRSMQITPRIEHAQHLIPADIPRFAELGVVASMQPYHKADDARYAEAALGHERCKSSYAFRSLLDAGAIVAFGSDWPVVTLDPFLGMHAAVTGETLDGRTFVTEQNITREEALRCYTVNAARAAGDGGRLGEIAVGSFADFTMLGTDPLDERNELNVPPERITSFVAGRQVHPGE